MLEAANGNRQESCVLMINIVVEGRSEEKLDKSAVEINSATVAQVVTRVCYGDGQGPVDGTCEQNKRVVLASGK